MVDKLRSRISRVPRTAWTLFVVGGAGAIATLVLAARADRLGDLADETYGFFLFVMVGGGVTWLVQRHLQMREERRLRRSKNQEIGEEEQRLLLQTYTELLTAYNKAKRVRRLLRARVLHAPEDRARPEEQLIDAAEYDEQLETLIGAQLEFESIKRRIEGNKSLFSDYPELGYHLDVIKSYLHETIEEYEDRRTDFSGDPPRLSVSELPELLNFLGPYGPEPEYWREFKRPFRSALSILKLAVGDRTEYVSQPLGVEKGVVKLVPYRRAWAKGFEEERTAISRVLGDDVGEIEHIGSTSVPDLEAMPILDLLVEVGSLDDARGWAEVKLKRLGYAPVTTMGLEREDCLLFERGTSGRRRTHRLFMAERESDFYRTQVQFRDCLRADSALRDEYADFKRRHAETRPRDKRVYAMEKAEFIDRVLERAEPVITPDLD